MMLPYVILREVKKMSVAQLPSRVPAPAFSPEELRLADEFLLPLWQVEPAMLPKAAQARFEEVGGQEGTAVAVARDAAAHSGAGLQCLGMGDVQGAFQHFMTSAHAFMTIEEKDGFVVNSALAKYLEGVIEAQKGNIHGAEAFMSEAEDLLKQAGGLARQYQHLLDHLKPDTLFITGAWFLQRQDYETGRAWIEQAAGASTRLADTYYEKDSPGKALFDGMSSYYRMIYDLAVSIRDLNICRYDILVGRAQEFRQRASGVVGALEKAAAAGIPLAPNVLPTARGISDTLDVIPIIAGVMTSVFQSTFRPDIPQLVAAKKGIQAAMNSFAAAGEMAVPMLRQIQQLSQKIDNVQLLVKPTGKHIVVLGGIITALLFVPILFGVSWTYDQFHWGAPPLQVVGLALLAAAIAGYGTSVLRLLPAILWGGRSSS
jgi:hypothetical protein